MLTSTNWQICVDIEYYENTDRYRAMQMGTEGVLE